MSGQPFDMIRGNSSVYKPVPNSIPEAVEAHELTPMKGSVKITVSEHVDEYRESASLEMTSQEPTEIVSSLKDSNQNFMKKDDGASLENAEDQSRKAQS